MCLFNLSNIKKHSSLVYKLCTLTRNTRIQTYTHLLHLEFATDRSCFMCTLRLTIITQNGKKSSNTQIQNCFPTLFSKNILFQEFYFDVLLAGNRVSKTYVSYFGN